MGENWGICVSGSHLDYELDHEVGLGALTAHGGVPALIEHFRSSGAAAADEGSVSYKRRKRGLSASEICESMLALSACGGEPCEDLDRLRGHDGLGFLLGHGLPRAQTARDFLSGFDEPESPLLGGGRSAVREGELVCAAWRRRHRRWWRTCRRRRRREWRRSTWTPPSWPRPSARPSPATTAGAAISLWWRYGRSRTRSWRTSSAAGTCLLPLSPQGAVGSWRLSPAAWMCRHLSCSKFGNGEHTGQALAAAITGRQVGIYARAVAKTTASALARPCECKVSTSASAIFVSTEATVQTRVKTITRSAASSPR